MVDAAGTIETLLSNNWNNSNTDSVTPTIDKIGDFRQKELDIRNKDYVLIYEVNEAIAPFGLGGQTWEEAPTVSIDIRTTYLATELTSIRAHLIKMKDEVLRIIKANVSDPDANYKLLLATNRRDLSDKRTGMGRMVIDVQLKRWGS